MTGEKEKVARNAGFAFMSEAANMLLTMVGGIVSARYLGKAGFGAYSFAIGAVWLAMALTDLGMSTLITREVARDRSLTGKYLPANLGLRLTIGTVLAALIAVLSPFISPDEASASALRLMALSLVIVPLGAYFVFFRATERLDLAAVVQISQKVALTAGIIAAAHFGFGLKGVIAANLAGSAVAAVLAFALLPVCGGRAGISFDTKIWSELAVRGLPFFAMSILTEIYNRIDHLLIPYLDSVQANGLYGVASRLSLMFIVIPNAVSAAVFPYFSRRSTEAGNPLRSGAAALYRYLGVAGFGLAVFVGIPAKMWLALLFGKQFGAASPAMMVLMAALPFLFLNYVNVAVLYALGKQKDVLRVTVFVIALDVVLDVVFIKLIGYAGAAYASLAVNIVSFGWTYLIAVKCFGAGGLLRELVLPAASGVCGGAALIMLQRAGVAMPLSIAVSAAVFAAMLIATKVVNRQDAELVADIIGRGRRKR